jgi:hypothetical protein
VKLQPWCEFLNVPWSDFLNVREAEDARELIEYVKNAEEDAHSRTIGSTLLRFPQF